MIDEIIWVEALEVFRDCRVGFCGIPVVLDYRFGKTVEGVYMVIHVSSGREIRC